jgi:hypothetical protein
MVSFQSTKYCDENWEENWEEDREGPVNDP